jgi:hypothetical protein
MFSVSNNASLPEISVHYEDMNDESIDSSSIILVFIGLFGLIGNVISLVTIFHSRLRKVGSFLENLL